MNILMVVTAPKLKGWGVAVFEISCEGQEVLLRYHVKQRREAGAVVSLIYHMQQGDD
jgi:hypothetical protein